jgi:hypothetical protein
MYPPPTGTAASTGGAVRVREQVPGTLFRSKLGAEMTTLAPQPVALKTAMKYASFFYFHFLRLYLLLLLVVVVVVVVVVLFLVLLLLSIERFFFR